MQLGHLACYEECVMACMYKQKVNKSMCVLSDAGTCSNGLFTKVLKVRTSELKLMLKLVFRRVASFSFIFISVNVLSFNVI